MASLEQLGMHVGRVNDDGWTAWKLIFIEFNDPFSNEREWENALNKKVREALEKDYENEVDAKLLPGMVMLPLITTEKIGSTLKTNTR